MGKLLAYVSLYLILHPGSLVAQGKIDSIINAVALREVVEFLASDSLKGRLTGSVGAMASANFIAEEFKKAGAIPLAPSQHYLISFQSPWHSAIGYNVIGILPGTEKSGEAIIFSAHYDHIGTRDTNPYGFVRSSRQNKNDSIFNGANDNASGVAALISLARYFGQLGNNKRSIIFMAFSGEELGLVGSAAVALTLKNPSMIRCLINLEMLGRGRRPFITGSELGNLQFLLNKELTRVDKARYKKTYFGSDPFPEQKLFARSDNFPFAQLRIPAHTIICTSDADPFYHQVDDEAGTLEYKFLAEVTRAIAQAVGPIIGGRVTPTRIDASEYSAPVPIR